MNRQDEREKRGHLSTCTHLLKCYQCTKPWICYHTWAVTGHILLKGNVQSYCWWKAVPRRNTLLAGAALLHTRWLEDFQAGELGAQNIFALPSSTRRSPKGDRTPLYLPDIQRWAGAWKSRPAKACIGALNLEGRNPVVKIIVITPAVAPGVAVKDLLCCARAAKPKYYSGAHSNSRSLHAHNTSAAEALGFVGCPPKSPSWDNLASEQQGYFLQKRVLCSENDFWHTLVGHYWNHL